MDIVQFIAAKRDGQEHHRGELREFVLAAVGGAADYQISAWLMAAYLRGLSEEETVELTGALRDSGRTFPLGHFGPRSVDKHSTGGVGDKTSLVIVPLCASLGAVVPKMSGRGLGFTGGTLDKLEAIPGFRSDLSVEEFERIVSRVGAAIAAQSADLVPADGRLYALRDVTATVDSVPLIAASVMSKKLALGCPSVVLDVKVGSGAFMPDRERGQALAAAMVAIGTAEGRRMAALLGDMSRPLGRAVGNSLEVLEAMETLRGGGPDDLRGHCSLIAGEMLSAAGVARSPEDGVARAEEALRSGRAADKMLELVEAQGGDAESLAAGRLPVASLTAAVHADSGGFVARVDARAVGQAAMALGAGRQRRDDGIDLGAGVVLRHTVGDEVQAGEPLATLHASTEAHLHAGLARLLSAFSVSEAAPAAAPLVHEVIRA